MRSLMTKSLFNPWEDFFAPTFTKNVMQSDIIEKEKEYELKIDLAGYTKEEISLELKNQILTISAQKQDKQEEGTYLTRERISSCSRSYKVGNVAKDSIKASYENGVLSIIIPKEQEALDTKILIS